MLKLASQLIKDLQSNFKMISPSVKIGRKWITLANIKKKITVYNS